MEIKCSIGIEVVETFPNYYLNSYTKICVMIQLLRFIVGTTNSKQIRQVETILIVEINQKKSLNNSM